MPLRVPEFRLSEFWTGVKSGPLYDIGTSRDRSPWDPLTDRDLQEVRSQRPLVWPKQNVVRIHDPRLSEQRRPKGLGLDPSALPKPYTDRRSLTQSLSIRVLAPPIRTVSSQSSDDLRYCPVLVATPSSLTLSSSVVFLFSSSFISLSDSFIRPTQLVYSTRLSSSILDSLSLSYLVLSTRFFRRSGLQWNKDCQTQDGQERKKKKKNSLTNNQQKKIIII